MFKCQPGYTLRKIKGINYLLPYGQQIADLKKGFVLNETSTFLWNVLQHHEGAEPQQLAEILARTYQLDESYYPELLKDVTDFLTQLTAMGMITEDLHLISSIPSVSMIIAGICIKLYGSAELISPNFKPFYHEFLDDDNQALTELENQLLDDNTDIHKTPVSSSDTFHSPTFTNPTYQNLLNLLSDCSPQELEWIFKSAQLTKNCMRNKNNS